MIEKICDEIGAMPEQLIIKQLQQENKRLKEEYSRLEEKYLCNVPCCNKNDCDLYEDYMKLKHNWNKLKEYVKENIRICKNRHYDLVYDIEEVPKEQQKEFIHYLVVESMQALIEKIEQGRDSNG